MIDPSRTSHGIACTSAIDWPPAVRLSISELLIARLRELGWSYRDCAEALGHSTSGSVAGVASKRMPIPPKKLGVWLDALKVPPEVRPEWERANLLARVREGDARDTIAGLMARYDALEAKRADAAATLQAAALLIEQLRDLAARRQELPPRLAHAIAGTLQALRALSQ